MPDIIITIPARITWQQYSEEIKRAANGEILNYQLQHFPIHAKTSDRCYICFRGFLIGWHAIAGFSEKTFICTTTGKRYSGKFIERTGKLHHIDCRLMKGFQGFIYMRDDDG